MLRGMRLVTIPKVGATNMERMRKPCQTAAGPIGSTLQPTTAAISQDRVERAAQVVDHFPARDGADACIGREQPWQKLPVAACPAMVARNVDIVAGRIILDYLHIADQRGTGIAAFQKV